MAKRSRKGLPKPPEGFSWKAAKNVPGQGDPGEDWCLLDEGEPCAKLMLHENGTDWVTCSLNPKIRIEGPSRSADKRAQAQHIIDAVERALGIQEAAATPRVKPAPEPDADIQRLMLAVLVKLSERDQMGGYGLSADEWEFAEDWSEVYSESGPAFEAWVGKKGWILVDWRVVQRAQGVVQTVCLWARRKKDAEGTGT